MQVTGYGYRDNRPYVTVAPEPDKGESTVALGKAINQSLGMATAGRTKVVKVVHITADAITIEFTGDRSIPEIGFAIRGAMPELFQVVIQTNKWDW